MSKNGDFNYNFVFYEFQSVVLMWEMLSMECCRNHIFSLLEKEDYPDPVSSLPLLMMVNLDYISIFEDSLLFLFFKILNTFLLICVVRQLEFSSKFPIYIYKEISYPKAW